MIKKKKGSGTIHNVCLMEKPKKASRVESSPAGTMQLKRAIRVLSKDSFFNGSFERYNDKCLCQNRVVGFHAMVSFV